MKDIKAKYAVYHRTSGKITLSNDDSKLRAINPLYEDELENVKITFNDNGSITIDADAVCYGIFFHDEYPENLSYKIHPGYITKTRFRKRDIVRAGWHRKLEKEHKKITINKYIIEEK